jgi:hypothetical protein
MRADLESDDMSVRIPVRRKVTQAFRSLTKEMGRGSDGMRIRLHADVALILIDCDGNFLHGSDLIKDGREAPAKLKDYARRRIEAKAEGKLFERQQCCLARSKQTLLLMSELSSAHIWQIS